MTIFSNATKGLVLAIVETRASDGKVYPNTGPFAIAVQDPANTITVVPGSDDQSTPDIFRPNGSGNVGTVTVDVTDTANNLKGSITFDVVAPPPPPPVDAPDTFTLSLTPEP